MIFCLDIILIERAEESMIISEACNGHRIIHIFKSFNIKTLKLGERLIHMEISYHFLAVEDIQMQITIVVVRHYKPVAFFILRDVFCVYQGSFDIKSGLKFHI